MQTLRTIPSLRATVQEWRRHGKRTVLVPTMGNLHEGHLHLVREAQGLGDHVVASVFVNPMQFGKNEDYGTYPRTLERDAALLAEHGVHALFAPEVQEIYPQGLEQETRVIVPGLSDILCGASRPGHFAGVATVVAKLFNIVRPDVAVFGEKDFQQLMIIRRMAQDLCFPLDIVGVPTVRESDGLAMSSRNQYLTAQERQIAPVLYQTLCRLRDDILAGARDYGCLEKEAVAGLEAAGFRPDYLSVRRTRDLAEPAATDTSLVILAAAWLGRTRLIDNVPLGLGR